MVPLEKPIVVTIPQFLVVELNTKVFSFPFRLKTFNLHAQLIPYFVMILLKTFQSVRLMINHINIITSIETISKYDVVVHASLVVDSKGPHKLVCTRSNNPSPHSHICVDGGSVIFLITKTHITHPTLS